MKEASQQRKKKTGREIGFLRTALSGRSHVNLDQRLCLAEAVILPHLSSAGEDISLLYLQGCRKAHSTEMLGMDFIKHSGPSTCAIIPAGAAGLRCSTICCSKKRAVALPRVRLLKSCVSRKATSCSALWEFLGQHCHGIQSVFICEVGFYFCQTTCTRLHGFAFVVRRVRPSRDSLAPFSIYCGSPSSRKGCLQRNQGSCLCSRFLRPLQYREGI